MARRPTLSTTVETTILTKSRRRCAICFGLNGDRGEKRGQIAHLDQDRTNNFENNLAFLCFEHHDTYDSSTSQSKNFTLPEVRVYRERLYAYLEGGAEQVYVASPAEVPAGSPVRANAVIQHVDSSQAVSFLGPPPYDASTLAAFMVVDDVATPEHLGLGAVPGARFDSSPAGGPPMRVITVVPYSVPLRLIELPQLAATGRNSMVRRTHGDEMFPVFPLQGPGIRKAGAVFWDHEDGKFGIAVDGSVAQAEIVVEAVKRRHRIWGSGVGLFYCLDRFIGALLYARSVLGRASTRRARIVLELFGVRGIKLAFDYDAYKPISDRNNHLFAVDNIRVGGNFDPRISDPDIVSFATELGLCLAYHAGCDDCTSKAIAEEVQTTILDRVRRSS